MEDSTCEDHFGQMGHYIFHQSTFYGVLTITISLSKFKCIPLYEPEIHNEYRNLIHYVPTCYSVIFTYSLLFK